MVNEIKKLNPHAQKLAWGLIKQVQHKDWDGPNYLQFKKNQQQLIQEAIGKVEKKTELEKMKARLDKNSQTRSARKARLVENSKVSKKRKKSDDHLQPGQRFAQLM